jgi:hypothetical protein
LPLHLLVRPSEDQSQPPKQAVAYVTSHIPRGATLLVDDNLWTDLVRYGFDPNPVWFYKPDLDRPSMPSRRTDGATSTMSSSGTHSVDPARPPLAAAAIEHSEVVASLATARSPYGEPSRTLLTSSPRSAQQAGVVDLSGSARPLGQGMAASAPEHVVLGRRVAG